MRKETTPVDLNSVESSPAKTHKNAAPCRADAIPPIVGVGASSSGGLQVLEHLPGNVPAGGGIGIVQHPDPSRKAMLPELLPRNTAMPVAQAMHGNKIKPNWAHVIQPGKETSISRGMPELHDPAESRGQLLPIDRILRSLADDRREPADVAVPAEALPAKTIALQDGITQFSHPHQVQLLERRLKGESPHALERIVAMLRHRTGNDFSLYKKNPIVRRIARRIDVHRLGSMSGYERYLRNNPQEVDLLFKEMLIGVTGFFRDSAVWDHLKEDALPTLLAAYPDGKMLRAWVPACSTGEEAYSLAIVFKEALEQAAPASRFSLQIFATDLNPDAIDQARQGIFSGHLVDAVSPERLRRFFIADGNGYRASDEIRKMIIFAQQNVATDPPFTKLDILTCRNLFIYLDPEMQGRLIRLFHLALNPGGLLLLGGAETIGSHKGLFSILDSKVRLYRRIRGPSVQSPQLPARPPSTKVPISAKPRAGNVALSLPLQADRFLLQNYSPAAVLVNRDGDILYINGCIRKYLEPAAGKANWNVYAMAREGLRRELADALKKAIQRQDVVTISNLPVIQNQGAIQTVDLTVTTIGEPEALAGLAMVIFTDVAAPAPEAATRRNPAGAKRAEASRTREEIQSMRNEIQRSNAELVAANEELQSANEELRATIEALNTSREQIQALEADLRIKQIPALPARPTDGS